MKTECVNQKKAVNDHDDSLITLEIRWRASQGFRGSELHSWCLIAANGHISVR